MKKSVMDILKTKTMETTTKQKLEEIKKFIGKPIIFKQSYMEEDEEGYDRFIGKYVIEDYKDERPIGTSGNVLAEEIYMENGKEEPVDRWVDLKYAKENCLETQIKITNILIKLWKQQLNKNN